MVNSSTTARGGVGTLTTATVVASAILGSAVGTGTAVAIAPVSVTLASVVAFG